MANNPNIVFKRGTHGQLFNVDGTVNSSVSLVDGAFYLTTDTGRLYTGVTSGTGDNAPVKLLDLNQYIVTYPNETALKAAPTPQLGDFAYISDGNILAVYKTVTETVDDVPTTTNKWVQINSQNTSGFLGDLIVDSNDSKSISITAADTSGASHTGTFTFADSASAVATVGKVGSTPQVTITSVTNDLAFGSITNSEVIEEGSQATDVEYEKIALTEGFGDTKTEVAKFGIRAGEGIELVKKTDADENAFFTFENTKHHYVEADGSSLITYNEVTGTRVHTQDSAIYYTIGTGDGKTVIPNWGNLGQYFYTKGEVDNTIHGLNGMTYRGVVNSSNALTTLGVVTAPEFSTTNVKIGDTYMAGQDFIINGELIEDNIITPFIQFKSGSNSPLQIEQGDLFIAVSFEEITSDATGGVTTYEFKDEINGYIKDSYLHWTFIKSGSRDTDTTYYADVTGKNISLIASTATDSAPTYKVSNSNADLTETNGVKGKILSSVTRIESNSTAVGADLTFGHAIPDAGDVNNRSTIDPSTAITEFTDTIDVISALTIDTTGHVVAPQPIKLKPITYELGESYLDVGTQAASVNITLTDSKGKDCGIADFDIEGVGNVFVRVKDKAGMAQPKDVLEVSLRWDTF